MEDDPKQHDFDQRHDGPFDRPSVEMHRMSRDYHRGHASLPHNRTGFKSGSIPLGRKSMQHDTRKSMEGGRRSMQPQRHVSDPMINTAQGTSAQANTRGRPSRDFDTRRDGPFGRPSLTMSRRRSSGNPIASSPDSRRPTHAGLQEALDEKDREEQMAASANEGQSPSDPVAPSVEMLQQEGVPFEPEPPSLNYTLATRKRSIIIFWSLIIVDCVVAPIAIYFGLWYGLTRKQLDANAVFSIVTAALGGVSIIEYIVRFWRLWKKGSTCRVIGARRKYLDWFHWNFSVGWVIIVVELIIGTIPDNPPIRLLAMPVASMLYAFGTQLIVFDILRYFQVPAPVRVSSIPKGSQLRPCIYAIIEDVVAVDGSGGTAFREALNRRYEASHIFRAMLRRLGVFWAIGAEGAAVVLTILIFTIDGEAAYVVGWAAPFVWAACWALATWLYVRHMLKKEKEAWREEVALKAEEGLGSGRTSERGAEVEGSVLAEPEHVALQPIQTGVEARAGPETT